MSFAFIFDCKLSGCYYFGLDTDRLRLSAAAAAVVVDFLLDFFAFLC
jgi:hypothetical protein